jgi:hypothetical protein
LLANPPTDSCGEIALAARETELNPVDVMFQPLRNAVFTDPVLATKTARRGPMAIAERCVALFPRRKWKSAAINLLACYFLPCPFRSFPKAALLASSSSRRRRHVPLLVPAHLS